MTYVEIYYTVELFPYRLVFLEEFDSNICIKFSQQNDCVQIMCSWERSRLTFIYTNLISHVSAQGENNIDLQFFFFRQNINTYAII